jgi:peptidoglycan hydrolase CwlO-like protein
MHEYITIISLALTPISSIVAWVVARRARNNDMLTKMQQTIDLLVEKNRELYEEVVMLRNKVAELSIGKP